MSDSPGNSKTIVSVDELVDQAIQLANQHATHNTEEFFRVLHQRILKSAKKIDPPVVEDDVFIVYFRAYGLVHTKTVIRTTLIAVFQTVADWIKKSH